MVVLELDVLTHGHRAFLCSVARNETRSLRHDHNAEDGSGDGGRWALVGAIGKSANTIGPERRTSELGRSRPHRHGDIRQQREEDIQR